jgi:hypothetical protein
MGNYIDKLDELIALKKNKGHKITKKESEEFASAWSELITAEGGFSEKAEQYFYDGFIFVGAKPFVNWVLLSEDKFSALDTLFKGHAFGKDAASTFRVLISTLAQLMRKKVEDKNLVCPLIKRIPSSSKNKEGKTIGDGHRVVLKYFVSEIDDGSVLPVLSELNLKPGFINSFISLFDELLSRLDVNALSKKDVQTLASINRWLHPSTVEDVSLKKDSETEQTRSEGQNEGASSPTHQEQSPPHANKNPYDQLISILNEATILSGNLRNASTSSEEKCIALQETIISLQGEVEALNVQLKASRQKESALEEQLADCSSQIARLSLKAKSLEETIQKLSYEIEAKDQEISQRSQMIEALSRDRAKQSDEQLHRLASTLKVEYRDFKDAETLTMDCDLGENIREQLKNVFSILIKAGIKLD